MNRWLSEKGREGEGLQEGAHVHANWQRQEVSWKDLCATRTGQSQAVQVCQVEAGQPTGAFTHLL